MERDLAWRDLRALTNTLSPAGREALDALEARLREYTDVWLTALDDAEVVGLLHLLSALDDDP